MDKAKRCEVLLRAAYDLLKKQDDSWYVTLNLLDETVYYDNAECSGACLLDDIKEALNIDD